MSYGETTRCVCGGFYFAGGPGGVHWGPEHEKAPHPEQHHSGERAVRDSAHSRISASSTLAPATNPERCHEVTMGKRCDKVAGHDGFHEAGLKTVAGDRVAWAVSKAGPSPATIPGGSPLGDLRIEANLIAYRAAQLAAAERTPRIAASWGNWRPIDRREGLCTIPGCFVCTVNLPERREPL